MLPAETQLYLDGGHNPAAGRAIGGFLRRELPPGGAAQIIIGMIEGKDAAGFLKPLAHRASGLTAVPVGGHACQPPEAIAAAAAAEGLEARTAASVEDALRALGDGAPAPVVLICGSLYLAGEVLKANGTPPT
jgi:dihydrofolate synthase/folylpolyglutamate synthase